jgi:putative iron-only hydrogenase system regulator
MVVEKRLGVVGIVVENNEVIDLINTILHEHAHIIVGRMGIPYKEKNVNVISVIVDGSTDDIGSLTGKLGKIDGVNVKSALTKKKQ